MADAQQANTILNAEGENFISHEVDLDEALMKSLSLKDRKILMELDMDGSGKVTLTEILGLLRHHKEDTSHLHALCKVFLFTILALVMLLAANTVATFAVVEMSKESKVKGDVMVSASTGQAVATANSEMKVDADGKLVPRAGGNKSNGVALKTTPTLSKVELASSLPDATLMGLDEVTVHSDKGHTLQIKVQGFSRVPVKNSRCGNVVNFYTAWKGRITLDSTDLTFDDATALEFQNAGFSLAVGGRRLAGKSKTDGFFKNMQDIKNSGKWRCAGVPLPIQSETSTQNITYFHPCGTAGGLKNGPDMCHSSYGIFLPGAGFIEKKHALAVVPKTKRISALVSGKTPEVIYVKTGATVMKSPSYTVNIETYPQHMGQERISIADVKGNKNVVFQFETGQARSHCVAEGGDKAAKAMQDAKADTKVDSDMHFELLDTVEEDGLVLRHFRMMPSDAFNTMMGSENASRPKDASYTEYWDVSDTLTPYRILSGDGTLTVLNKVTPTCSDADVEAELKKRLSGTIASLMTCSDVEKKTTPVRPTMESPYNDLSEQDGDYYVTKVFGTQEEMEALAGDGDDTSDKAKYARYLDRANDKLAMPDWCYNLCKESVDKFKAAFREGKDVCAAPDAVLVTALTCLDASNINVCQSNNFVSYQHEECGVNKTRARRLEDYDADELDSDTMVPVETLADGTQAADLSKSARLVFNMTTKRDAVYDKLSLASSPLSSRRNLIGVKCTSKMGRIKWMGDGWCMKWNFKKFGFSLQLKFGRVSGSVGVVIVCQACVPILLVFSIPPPLVCKMCVGGLLSVTIKKACPYIPLTIAGKVYWNVACKANFGIISITIAKLEIGIFAAVTSFKKETKCWWICGEGRRRRRRSWSRRRRNTRQCNFTEDCDIKVGAYVEITLAVVKGRLDVTYWVKNKTMVAVFTISAFEVWKAWWGGWKKMWSTTVCKYKW